MDLTRYVQEMQDHLVSTVESVTDGDGSTLADGLLASHAAASQLILLGALSDAASKINDLLEGARVEVRLRGREPEFVVLPHDDPSMSTSLTFEPGRRACDANTLPIHKRILDARFTVRMPGELKAQISATAKKSSVSMNTWLITLAARNL